MKPYRALVKSSALHIENKVQFGMLTQYMYGFQFGTGSMGARNDTCLCVEPKQYATQVFREAAGFNSTTG
jgi:hypothetical protein